MTIWRTSSRSNSQGNCVAVAVLDDVDPHA